MKYDHVEYFGAKLIVPEFIVPLFPVDLPPEKWPTFCGAGDGWGDVLVSDNPWGIHFNQACFTHDIDWAVTPETIYEFIRSNWHFFKNCMALVRASKKSLAKKILALGSCIRYFAGVSTFGLYCFLTSEVVPFDEGDPFRHPVVRSRLKRLARADMGLVDEIAARGGYDDQSIEHRS